MYLAKGAAFATFMVLVMVLGFPYVVAFVSRFLGLFGTFPSEVAIIVTALWFSFFGGYMMTAPKS